MIIQTYKEAENLLRKYLNINKPIIIIGEGNNGKKHLINCESLVKKNKYNVYQFHDETPLLNEIEIKKNYKFICIVNDIKKIKEIFIRNLDVNIIDMNNLYCGLPKSIFEKKYVKAFNCEVPDYNLYGDNVQSYLRNYNQKIYNK